MAKAKVLNSLPKLSKSNMYDSIICYSNNCNNTFCNIFSKK